MTRRPRSLQRALMGSLVAVVLASSGLFLEAPTDSASTVSAVDCARRYLAGGDHLPAGHDVSDSEKYPKQLLDDHLSTWGPWCLYNTSANETTSSSYISGGQLARSWNLSADLVTIQLGGENSGIVDLIDSCFDKLKDHDFTGADVQLNAAQRLKCAVELVQAANFDQCLHARYLSG